MKKADIIDKSLNSRIATGALANTVPVDKSAPKEVVFKLKIKGKMPKLKEAAEDPEESKRKLAEGPVIDYVALKKADVIDKSLDSRKATGAVNNTIPLDKNAP